MDSVSVDKQATLERPLYQRAPQPERPPTIMSESILSFTSTESARPDSPPSSIAISLTDVSSATIPASVLNGSSPVPPQCPSTPPPPPLVNCTPQKSLKTRQSPSKPISDFVEVSRYEYCKPRIDTKRAGRIEFCEKLEPKRISMVAEWSEPKANSSDDETLIQAKNTTKVMIEPETIVIRDENKPQEVKSVIIPPAPVITDIRVMKEAAESPLKTPIVERKLPPLPKTLSIPVEEENEGGKLYIEKKESLRSTFDVINNDQSEISDLDAKHRALLDKNRNILKRQQEELKALGVIL
ncbi:hypothetical protein AB6A40_006311 [Gnathostoma spinigerum]|uniref:Uncharacterized protein n=1 Tax=Gnathostoma spinigerum TaxID=75299 RepID=A0ABD6EK88_9BILA